MAIENDNLTDWNRAAAGREKSDRHKNPPWYKNENWRTVARHCFISEMQRLDIHALWHHCFGHISASTGPFPSKIEPTFQWRQAASNQHVHHVAIAVLVQNFLWFSGESDGWAIPAFWHHCFGHISLLPVRFPPKLNPHFSGDKQHLINVLISSWSQYYCRTLFATF